jgi:hypothetical protein
MAAIEPMEDEEAPESEEGEEDPCVKAFRVLRHAVADGDDEAGAEALKHFVALCGDEEDDEPAGRRPNLAMILMGKKKKD